jgi:hypothetical protein
LWRLEVEIESFSKILKSFFFGFALAGNIDFQALGHIPVAFFPDRCGEWAFHAFILA